MPRTEWLLETETGKQEVPSMGKVIKLDDQRRGVFPDPFKPGDTLVVDVLGPDTISMHLAKPAEMATVEPRWVKGRLLGAAVQLSRAEIAAAVRADRNAR